MEKPMEYAKPEISDYGTVQELTATSTSSGYTDVPKGTPGEPGDPLFSPNP